MRSKAKTQYTNIGLLILRIGLGISFMFHGYPKLLGGPEMWEEVGTAMQVIGIDFAPVFWGFMAGITELFGGLFLLLGLFFRPALILLITVMAVAAASHVEAGDSFSALSHSIELAIVFISLLFMGPGKHSLDKKLHARNRRRY